MKEREVWSIRLVLLSTMLIGPCLVNSGDLCADEGAIKINIKLSDPKIVLGQPLTVTIELTNMGKAPIELSGSESAYRIMISEDGEQYKWYRSTEEMTKREKWKTLSPGKAAARDSLVFYTITPLFQSGEDLMRHFAFPKSGKYFLQVRYGKFTSDPATVVVTKPLRKDVRPLARLKETAYPYFVQWPHCKAKDSDLTVFRKVLRWYPNSTYSKYLGCALVEQLRSRKKLSIDEDEWLKELEKRYGKLMMSPVKLQ